MAQPKATRQSPRLALNPLKNAATSAGDRLGLQGLVVEHAGDRPLPLTEKVRSS